MGANNMDSDSAVISLCQALVGVFSPTNMRPKPFIMPMVYWAAASLSHG